MSLSSSSGDSHTVVMALGTNSDSEVNMMSALEQLGRVICVTARSRLVWTEPVGMVSGPFLNCMLRAATRLTLGELVLLAKRVERHCGRTAEDKAKGVVSIDVDIMEYDGQKLHPDDWQRDYIKSLYREI